MKKPLTDEDLLERAGIDGRVAFALAAFALGAGLVALLDRLGVPERLVSVLAPVAAAAGLATVGLLVRTMRVSRFYAAGRAVPGAYAGLALASIGVGLFLPFAPPAPGGTSFPGLLIGFGSGFFLAALVVGPFLRKTGAFSIPDLIASRFPNLALRLGVVAVVAAVGVLIGLAGFETAVRALMQTSGASRLSASILTGLVLILIVVPGGVTGVVWTATGAAGIFLAAFAFPMGILMSRGVDLPFPVLGDAALWTQALARMTEWHTVTTAPDQTMASVLVAAIAIGVAVLAPLLSPAMTCRDGSSARRAGLAAVLWTGAFAALVGATMALTAQAFDQRMAGQRPDRLPDFVYSASAKGLVTICGQSVSRGSEAMDACRKLTGFNNVLRAEDYAATGAWLTIGLPASRGLSVAFSGLVGAALTSVAMMIAAAGFQIVGTAIGHDAFYRVRDSSALTSRRLAITRIVLIVAVVACGAIIHAGDLDARTLIGLAIAFSTATLAPLLALSLWPRAAGADATIALLVGLATAEAVIVTGASSPSLERLAASAVIACVAAFVCGVATSLFREGGPESQGGAFVEGVLHGEQDVLNPDKGA